MKRFVFLWIYFLSFLSLEAQPFSLDSTFNSTCPTISPLYSTNEVTGIIQESNGSLLIYGSFREYDYPYINSIRNDYYGNLLSTWNFNTTASVPIEAIKAKDSIYYAYTSDIMLKLNDSGFPDTSWSNNTLRCFTWFNSYAVDYYIFPDHRMLLTGTYRFNPYPGPYTYRHFLRLKPNGELDSTFKHYPNDHVYTLLKYNNHQFMLGGFFTSYDSIPIRNICRIDTAGNLDTTFHSIFPPFQNYIQTPRYIPTYVQDDGKIIVTGTFKIQNCPDTLMMVRLNPDGSLDSTFNNFNNIYYIHINGRRNYITTICQTTDGGFLIGGQIDIYQGHTRKHIVKTDANGFIEPNYFYDGGIDSTKHPYDLRVRKIEPAPGGQYYVMGCFRTYYDQLVPPIIRINSITNGVYDPAKPNEYFLLFPNPATTEATIRFTMLTSGGKLRVYNTLGQIITEEEIPQGSNEYKLNVSRYKSGLYKVILLEKNEVRGQQSMVIHR